MEKIQAMGIEKSRIRDTILEVMELKLQQQAPKAAAPTKA